MDRLGTVQPMLVAVRVSVLHFLAGCGQRMFCWRSGACSFESCSVELHSARSHARNDERPYTAI